MATTRKPADRGAAMPVKRLLPVKPSAKLAATPAGKRAADRAAKAKGKPAKPKAKSGIDAASGSKLDRATDSAKATKADKPKKQKLVRDSFTIPKAEYALLATMKTRAAGLGKPVKKSELLRAGIKALAALPDLAFVSALDALPARKAERPALP